MGPFISVPELCLFIPSPPSPPPHTALLTRRSQLASPRRFHLSLVIRISLVCTLPSPKVTYMGFGASSLNRPLSAWKRGMVLKSQTAGVQPRLIQGIRSGDGVGDLFNYLFIKDIKSNRMRIAQ